MHIFHKMLLSKDVISPLTYFSLYVFFIIK